jgi:uncharacterized protein YceK
MQKVAFSLSLAIATVLLSGCGTLGDALGGPIDGHVFYRGVRLDLAAAKEGWPHILMLADIPASAIADTALIPLAVIDDIQKPDTGVKETSGESQRHD